MTEFAEGTRVRLVQDIPVPGSELQIGDTGVVRAAWEKQRILILWDKDQKLRSVARKRLQVIDPPRQLTPEERVTELERLLIEARKFENQTVRDAGAQAKWHRAVDQLLPDPEESYDHPKRIAHRRMVSRIYRD